MNLESDNMYWYFSSHLFLERVSGGKEVWLAGDVSREHKELSGLTTMFEHKKEFWHVRDLGRFCAMLSKSGWLFLITHFLSQITHLFSTITQHKIITHYLWTKSPISTPKSPTEKQVPKITYAKKCRIIHKKCTDTTSRLFFQCVYSNTTNVHQHI